MGKMFLVVVDAHSKWLDVKGVDAATSTERGSDCNNRDRL
jgi:hypothetical protein